MAWAAMSRVSPHRDRSTVDTYSALVRSFGIDVGGVRRGHAAVLLDALAPDYPLFLGGDVNGRALEVFPHATTYVLGGGPEPPGKKRAHRLRLLEEAGIDTRSLRTADEVDAALAAYTGWLALRGECRAVGNPEEGVIVIPAGALPRLSISNPSRSSYG